MRPKFAAPMYAAPAMIQSRTGTPPVNFLLPVKSSTTAAVEALPMDWTSTMDQVYENLALSSPKRVEVTRSIAQPNNVHDNQTPTTRKNSFSLDSAIAFRGKKRSKLPLAAFALEQARGLNVASSEGSWANWT
mmetsp:Transcript_33847/g.67211  ORF Transcript_33847/g.67211 Transcript_33847/m.67211 type:complete len:133 (+) Transcript_33847:24-422(+)